MDLSYGSGTYSLQSHRNVLKCIKFNFGCVTVQDVVKTPASWPYREQEEENQNGKGSGIQSIDEEEIERQKEMEEKMR